MYNCYASSLRWNKSPIKCTACGDAEKFLLVGSPLVAHPHASFPQLPGPLKQLTSPYLLFVIFVTQKIFLENKIYTEIYTVNCQFTQ